MAFPTEINLVTVTGRIEGVPEDVECLISFQCRVWQNSSLFDVSVPPFTESIVAQSDGTFSVDLPPNNHPDWQPQGWTYYVTIQYANKFLKGSLSVPYDSAGLTIHDHMVMDQASSPGVLYVPIAFIGADNGVAPLDDEGFLPLSRLPIHEHEADDINGLEESLSSVQGTSQNAFSIGSNMAGTKALQFKNGFTSQLQASPTAGRTWSLPDVNGSVVLDSAMSWQSEDHNLGGWTYDPVLHFGTQVQPTAGLMQVARIKFTKSLISNIHFHLTGGGNTLTANQCFAALFTDAGAFLGITSSLHGTGVGGWGDGGAKTHPLLVPQVWTPGAWCRVGWWFNGTAGATFSRAGNNGAPISNIGLTAPNLRYSTANAGLTTAGTVPANLGAQTAGSPAYWVGLS